MNAQSDLIAIRSLGNKGNHLGFCKHGAHAVDLFRSLGGKSCSGKLLQRETEYCRHDLEEPAGARGTPVIHFEFTQVTFTIQRNCLGVLSTNIKNRSAIV